MSLFWGVYDKFLCYLVISITPYMLSSLSWSLQNSLSDQCSFHPGSHQMTSQLEFCFSFSTVALTSLSIQYCVAVEVKLMSSKLDQRKDGLCTYSSTSEDDGPHS